MKSLSCFLIEPKLAAFAAEALPERESSRVAQHLDVCTHCHSEVEALRGLSGLLRQAAPDVTEPSQDLWGALSRAIEAEPPRMAPQPTLRRPPVALVATGALAGVALAATVTAHRWQQTTPAPTTVAIAPKATITPKATAPPKVMAVKTAKPKAPKDFVVQVAQGDPFERLEERKPVARPKYLRVKARGLAAKLDRATAPPKAKTSLFPKGIASVEVGARALQAAEADIAVRNIEQVLVAEESQARAASFPPLDAATQERNTRLLFP